MHNPGFFLTPSLADGFLNKHSFFPHPPLFFTEPSKTIWPNPRLCWPLALTSRPAHRSPPPLRMWLFRTDTSYGCLKHLFVRQGQVCRQDAGSQRADGVQSRSGCSAMVEAGGCDESGWCKTVTLLRWRHVQLGRDAELHRKGLPRTPLLWGKGTCWKQPQSLISDWQGLRQRGGSYSSLFFPPQIL